MKPINYRILFICIAFVLFLLNLGQSNEVHAARLLSPGVQQPVELVVKGGDLSFSVGAPSAPTSTPLTDATQTISYTIPVTVTDATGSGDGWVLRLANSDGISPQSAGASFVTAVTVACAADSTCSLPRNPISYRDPIVLGTETMPIFAAAHDTGMGRVVVSVKIAVVLPADTSINDYHPNFSMALSRGQNW